MFHFEELMIIELKQREIERKARNAWKFSRDLKEAPLQKPSTNQNIASSKCCPCEIC